MANAKVISLIAAAQRQEQIELAAVTADLYAAIVPLQARLDMLQGHLVQLKERVDAIEANQDDRIRSAAEEAAQARQAAAETD